MEDGEGSSSKEKLWSKRHVQIMTVATGTIAGIVILILGWFRVWPFEETPFEQTVFFAVAVIVFLTLVGSGGLDLLFPGLQSTQPLYEDVLKGFSDTAKQSRKEEKDYAEGLEKAKGDDIFKYLLLINVSALKGYVAQTRLQASQSFRLSQVISVIGFGMLIFAVALGIYTHLFTHFSLDAAYLAALAGILTEFISGVFFYIYNKTLQQINLFHDKLVSSQRDAVGFLACITVTDETMRNEGKIALAKLLVAVERGS